MKTLSHKEISSVGGAGYGDAPGWGFGIGGLVGNIWGPVGSGVGAIAGHVIEKTDYHQLGENYKEHVSNEIASGYYPAD